VRLQRASWVACLTWGAVACDGDSSTGGGDGGAVTSSSTSSTGAGGAGGGGAGASGGAGGEAAAEYTATLTDVTFRCKLLSGAFLEDPTANDVQTRFNLKGSDLGIPIVLGEDLHFFFGDTVGYKVIWDFGEDPDSVARVPFASVLRDPSAICDDLDFYVTSDVPSVANGVDPTIERDFAGAFMTPPDGQLVEQYIAQPAGPFANMPGTFEVPSGGLEQDGKAYLFYAGLVQLAPTRATISYLARWDVPGATQPSYQIVRALDALSGGALGGHFIQIAPVELDGSIHLLGTGDYRHSGVYLARVDAADLEVGAEQAIFDPAIASYRDAASITQEQREAIGPIFEVDGVGELSVSYVADAGLLIALYQRELRDGSGNIIDNRVLLRVSASPEGPWSEAVTIIDMADPAFSSSHCCGATCPGNQILHCDRAGLYGAYVVPAVTFAADEDGGTLDVPFVVSTWDPYNVVLFSTRVRVVAR